MAKHNIQINAALAVAIVLTLIFLAFTLGGLIERALITDEIVTYLDHIQIENINVNVSIEFNQSKAMEEAYRLRYGS